MSLAEVMNKTLDVLAELACAGVGGPAFEQSQFLLQFLGFGLDVGETGLVVLGLDAVIGKECIAQSWTA